MWILLVFSAGFLFGAYWKALAIAVRRQERWARWRLRHARRLNRRAARPKHRLTLCLVRTTKRGQRLTVVQNENGDWKRIQAVCVELFAAGRLKLPELHGADHCQEFLETRRIGQ